MKTVFTAFTLIILLGISGCIQFQPTQMSRDKFHTLKFHILEDDLVVEFGETSMCSSTLYCKPTVQFTTNKTDMIVEISLSEVLGAVHDSGIEMIKNGNMVFYINCPSFNPKTDRVYLIDEEGQQTIPFEGYLNKPFEKYVHVQPEVINLEKTKDIYAEQ
ncbi:MAG: hypothetical protein JXR23_05315 [Pontiellaceae bacterium]|nr:hypothetical protein [Pontiellaceae bacterium]